MIQGGGIRDWEPVLIQLLFRIAFLSQLIQLSQYRWSEHVLDINPARTFGIQEKEELFQSASDIHLLEVLVDALEVVKGGNQFRDVFLEVVLGEVAVSSRVVKADVNTGLEQIVFTHYGVEEGLHVDTAVLVTVKLQESWGAEKVTEF